MWFSTRMKPPDSGMFSPPSHSWVVVANSAGFTMATPRVHAHPRFCCNLRTVTGRRLLGHRALAGERPDRIETMSAQQFVVLVPVKPPAVGKSRLLGLDADVRRALAEAFAQDTVAACLAADRVSQVLVVTDDVRFSAVLAALGAETMPDGVTGDLNGALRLAAAEAHRRWPELAPVALCADLPALRPRELDAALARVRLPHPWF